MLRTFTSLSLTFLPLFAAAIPAQKPAQAGQVVCFSFDGTGKLSGKDNTGKASRTGVRVGGQSFFVGGAGSSTADCATGLLNKLTAAGFTASKGAANVVCVTAGKNGAPLTTGGIIGTTDTGLDGIDCEVEKPQPKPGQKPPKKPLKTQGVKVPQVKPGVKVTVTETITIEVEVEVTVNGKKVTIKIKVQVTITRGMSSQQANQAMEQAFRRAGLCPIPVVRFSPFLNLPVPSFALEFDCLGNPVHHAVLWQPQQDLFPIEIGAGDFPMFGAAAYGESSGSCPQNVFLGVDGYPGIGGRLNTFVQGGFPGGTWLPVIGFGEADIPLLGGFLLVDPTNLLLLPNMQLDPLGGGGLSLPLPPNPALAGLGLHMQSLVMDPQNKQQCLTNGQKVTIGK